MRTISLIILVLLLGSFSKPYSLKKRITGHWATNDDMGVDEAADSLKQGNAVTLTKIKFNEKLYHWGGGYLSGIEFKGDSGFMQYRNVLCSDETDTRICTDEKYFFVSDSVVEVKSMLRDFRFKILYVDSKKLRIKIIGFVQK